MGIEHTFQVTVDFMVRGSVDIECPELHLDYNMIPKGTRPKGTRKGHGLGKDLVLQSDIQGLQCDTCIDGMEKEYEEMQELCYKISKLAVKLNELCSKTLIPKNELHQSG